MTLANPFASVPQGVSYNAADAGAAAGSASGAGAGTGSSSGAAASGGAGQSGGTGTQTGASSISLQDDTPVTIGGKNYGSFKEYRAEVEGGARNLTQAEIRQNLATLAKQLQQSGQLGKGQQAQPQQRVDPFAGIRDMAFVDGKTLEALYNQGLGPIAQAIQQLQQQNKQLGQTIQQLRGGVQPIAQQHSNQEFQQRKSAAIATLNGVDVKDPFVSELAEDVFHSYEWGGKTQAEKDAEYHKHFGDRYAAAEKHFKAKFRAELDAAKQKKWQRPGGNATPSGAATNPLARASARDIARNVFAGSATNT